MTRDQGRIIHALDRPAWEQYHELYRAKVALFDHEVGRVFQSLQQSGLLADSIVVITSDHGDMDTHHRLIFKGPFMYDQMVRVPLMIRMPPALGGQTPRTVSEFDAVLTDLLPTLLDFAGAPVPACDGFSLRPFLTDRGARPVRDYVVSQYFGKQQWVTPIRMLRTADWKYNRYLAGDAELYDLKNDPAELHNLAADAGYLRQREELARELEFWMERNSDPFHDLGALDPEPPHYPSE